MSTESTSPLRKRLIAAGLGVGVLVGTAGLASALTAQTDSTTRSDTAAVPADDGSDEANEPADVNQDETDDAADDAADRDGDHGHGPGDRTPLTDQQVADLTAAAQAAVPGGTVESVSVEGNGSGAAFEAHVTDASGTEVEVAFDADLNVIEVAPH